MNLTHSISDGGSKFGFREQTVKNYTLLPVYLLDSNIRSSVLVFLGSSEVQLSVLIHEPKVREIQSSEFSSLIQA